MSSSLRIPSLHPIQEIVTLHPNSTDNDNSVVTVNNKATDSIRCYICAIRPGQYTCPRCHIPYCSVSCYQKHGVTSPTSDSDASSTVSGCIENFYERRVTQILQLEVSEQSQQFKQQQMYHENSYVSSDTEIHYGLCSSGINQDANYYSRATETTIPNFQGTSISQTPLNREELVQIWSILEQIEERKYCHASDDTDAVTLLQQRLQQHCSIRVQKAVQHAIKNLTTEVKLHDDESTKKALRQIYNNVAEWIMEPWSPWWSRDFVPFGEPSAGAEFQINDDVDDEKDGCCCVDDSKTPVKSNDGLRFDEQLLSVPRFYTLYRTKQCLDDDSSKQRLPQFPQLQYNLVDILFATAYTLRTFHGVRNIGNDIAMDAATTLITSSVVLLKDQRYTSVESALMACCDVHHPIQQQMKFYDRTNSNHYVSSSDRVFQLLQDVALIYQNHRYIARALLEASDILQQTITEMKRAAKPQTTNSKSKAKRNVAMGNSTNETRNHIRRIQKKIVFYLSWTMAVSTVKMSEVKRGWPYSHVGSDIQVWIEGWQLPTKAKSIKISV